MGERRPVLLTVSGTIPDDLDEQVAAGRRPRADYRVLADRVDADVVDVAAALAATGRIGRVLHRLGGAGPLLAWYVFRRRRRYQVVLTDGEQVGIPLALLMRMLGTGGLRHVMIVHVLSVPKKARVLRWARLAPLIGRYVVYCTAQAEWIERQLGVPPTRIVVTPFMVDTTFFGLGAVDVPRRRMICSAGLERRDYPTLMAAVDGLDVEVVIAAASPWSKQPDSSRATVVPTNVTIERFDLHALRELYAASQFVVMPLVDVDFQAGITTILEAMAMERAVICTRTQGQNDTILEGVTGWYVSPADSEELRAAIVRLLGDPPRSNGLGEAARNWVEEHAAIERYADVIEGVVRSATD
ncbi:MAG: glycosyltransferase family 4 protein [Ilumatobacteraceae bacterium]|nr:glycosyltransferase family 4 protein [Ilumatobacteraceae bacterium]